MAQRKKYNYKDKKVIISIFNESQSHHKRYKELLVGNPTVAQKELNDAGKSLQQAFELGLKCYLNRRYKELYNNGMMSWRECERLVKIIENGNQPNGQMVNIKYLCNQMDIYAEPARNNSGVDFEIIKKNAKVISNDNKHNGNDVDIETYEESYSEIRKFILKYIDDNPPIQMIQTPEYMNLQEACDFWDANSRYNYCLVCDKSSLDDLNRRKLLYINWSLIIDFDIDTENSGLYKSYVDEYGIQPNSFDVLNAKNTVFNAASKLPYWFHINGVKDMPESLVDSDRRWNQKYGHIFSVCLRRYRETFSKPLKIVILSGNVKRIEKMLPEFDAVYEDDLRIFLLSDEVQFEQMKLDYDEIVQYYPMSERELAQGINNFSSLFNRKKVKGEYYVCGRDGKAAIKLDEFSCFDIPYLGIEDDSDELGRDSEAFYQGKTALSWYGAKNGFAINRFAQYRKIKNDIISFSKDTTSKVIRLFHDPGAGGTTLSRMIAFDLSKEMPVVLLTSYNDRITPMQLSNFYRQVNMSVLIVVESSIINDEDLQKFVKELMAKAVPHVLLHVRRTKKNQSSDGDLRYLVDDEFFDMLGKLNPYLDNKSRSVVENLIVRPNDRYPFFMSMYAFDERFEGVEAYIEHYMKEITKKDYDMLAYISLADKYANRALDINFLQGKVDEGLTVFENNVNENLVVVENIGYNSYVKIRHPRFATEILKTIIYSGKNKNSMAPAENLSILIRRFIRYSKQNIMYDLDSTIDMLKNLLILRDTDSLVYNKFAPVIEELQELVPINTDDNSKYNCIGLVFKELVEVYPEEPHFKAHLSRYYSHIEKNYDKGIQEAKAAVDLSEQQGAYDSLLYHIYGMSIRRYVEQKLYVEAKECYIFGEEKLFKEKLANIQSMLEMASNQFKKVRETNNKVAGYISDIEMCIALVDFGKDVFNCTTESFVNEYKDSWMMQYYDRALTLMEGFRAIQVEEDTEFYRVRLTTKCTESLQDMIYNIENTVNLWETYLQRASEEQKPVVRRFIARAKEKSLSNREYKDVKNVNLVMQLMEENIKQEPTNGANIRIWFNALRYVEGSNPDILLDEALQKLATWKQVGDNFESYYYYFILICIKAIEGSSRAEAIIPALEQELKAKTSHMPNNRVIYEWLGVGRGVGRLINAYELSNGRYRRRPLEIIEKEACYIEGRISKYKNDRSAQIRAYNMEVFFAPSGQNMQASIEDINKKVKFILGFSYDGLRALNKSVQLMDSGMDDDIEDDMIGRMVKCAVQGQDSSGNFLKVKLVDYRNTQGSIHNCELPEGKTIFDYQEQDIVWGKVIGARYVERERKTYYQIRVRDEECIMTEWQAQLASVSKELK